VIIIFGFGDDAFNAQPIIAIPNPPLAADQLLSDQVDSLQRRRWSQSSGTSDQYYPE
jgi:hypothetical protein